MLRKLCLRRRRYWYLVIICVFLLFAYIQIIEWNSDNSSRSLDKVHMFDQSEDGKLFSNRHSKNTDEEEHTHQIRDEDKELDRIHRKRRTRLQEVCSNRNLAYLGKSREEQVREHFIFDEKSRVLYCTIEKVGSTFWRRLFQILAGKSKVKSPFDIMPAHALGGNVHTFVDLPFHLITSIVSSFTKFLIVRNPFERLYSGYVDKIFSLHFAYIGKHIVVTQRKNATRHSKNCGHDVTFAEFVRYVIKGERTNKNRNAHFSPMYDHCKPCQIGYDFIGKLETFEKDTMYILRKLNFSSVASGLEKDFRGRTTNDSAADQADLLFKYAKIHRKCIDPHEIQKIYWRKEQIRGLIDPDIPFPFTEKESQNLTAAQYLNAIHRSIGRAKNKDMAKQFRRDAMLKAYSTIPSSDMQKLKKIFKPDCDIFSYDCNSP